MPRRVIPYLKKETTILIVGFIGLLLTSILSSYLYKRVKFQQRIRFNFEARGVINQIKNRMDRYEAALIQTRALFLSVPNINKNRFQDYIAKTELLERYPGIQGLGYVAIVKDADLASFEKLVGREVEGFNVWPKSQRDIYTTIVFLEPTDRRNLKAVGYDMFSEPVRRRAMEEARDSGKPVLSGAVNLVQDADNSFEVGFNLYLAVYQGRAEVETVEERRKTIIGYVYSPFRSRSLFNEIYKIPRPLLKFKVYAGDKARADDLIYSREVRQSSPSPLTGKILVKLGHRDYLFTFESLPKFDQIFSYAPVILTLVIGFIVTILLMSVIYIIRSRHDQMEKTQLAIENISDNFKNLFMQIPELVSILKDSSHIFDYANDSYIKALGFNPTGRSLKEVQPESVEIHQLIDEVYQAGETIILHEFAITLGQGEVKRFFNVTFSPLRDEAGKVNGVMTIAAEVSEEVHIREKLQEQTEILAFAHRSAKMGAWNIDLDKNEFTLSSEALRIIGLDDFAGSTEDFIEKIVFNDDKELFSKELQMSVLKKTLYYCEHRIKTRSGEVRWILSQGRTRYNEEGEALSISGVIIDITEKKASEQELDYQLHLTKIITDNAASGMFVMDYKGYPSFMNPAAERLTGYFLNEIIDKPLHFSIHHLKADGKHYSIDECPLNYAREHFQFLHNQEDVFVDKLGRRFPVSYSISPLRKEGEVIGSVLEFRNISDVKKRQRQLEILAETSLLLNSPLALEEKIKLIPEKGREIIDCHQALIALVNEFSGEPDPSYSFYSYSTEHGNEDENNLIKNLLEDDLFRIKGPMKLSRINPEDIFSTRKDVLLIPLINSDGTNLGVMQFRGKKSGSFTREDEYFIVQLSQIAATAIENIQLLKKEQKAVKSRDEFLSIASHELKTPLTTLSLHTQMYQRELRNNVSETYPKDKVDKLVGIFSSQIGRLIRLIDDMLDVSRISAKKLNIKKNEFDLSLLIVEMLQRLSTLFASYAVETPAFTPIENAIGYWDRFRLEQVIENLITNALRYGRGRPINISLSADDTKIRISVKDQGVGIPEELAARIFNRFERAINPSEIRGLGLGLFIVEQIVKAHGGRVWVESELNVGSDFIIELPKEPAQDDLS